MIFLSHSSLDKSIIEEIAFELLNKGYNVWLDKWEIENGDFITKKLDEGIGESSQLLFFYHQPL